MPGFVPAWRAVKRGNKVELCALGARPRTGCTFDPEALLDAQCKRIHEYKRQHLNLLHVIALWNRIRQGDDVGLMPRTFLFAGKAAPSYRLAKLIIRLVHGVAEAIAADPRARQRLRVVFVPDFNVKTAQRIYPAADLSEQISTAGKEASGTGNMKFMLNGALTIGTLDGANIEIREAVGAEQLLPLRPDRRRGRRRGAARAISRTARSSADPELAAALDLIANGAFSRGDRGLFAPLLRTLLEHDPFLVLADFRAYVNAQERVAPGLARSRALDPVVDLERRPLRSLQLRPRRGPVRRADLAGRARARRAAGRRSAGQVALSAAGVGARRRAGEKAP